MSSTFFVVPPPGTLHRRLASGVRATGIPESELVCWYFAHEKKRPVTHLSYRTTFRCPCSCRPAIHSRNENLGYTLGYWCRLVVKSYLYCTPNTHTANRACRTAGHCSVRGLPPGLFSLFFGRIKKHGNHERHSRSYSY